MTKGEAINWIINISADIGKVEYRDLWHYEQALSEIREILEQECEKCIFRPFKQFQPKPQWIPCSELLPKIKEHHTSEPCIVYCDNEVYAFAELEENIFGQVGWNCERDDDYHEAVGTVIAWMPLPEPWKGGV